MKTLYLILISFSISFSQEASIFDGLLNVANWISGLNEAIEKIDDRESLKKLNRQLSYLSTDIHEVINSKKELDQKLLNPEFNKEEYLAEAKYLEESMQIFKDRFNEINKLVPTEFKVEENPLTQNIEKLVWEKIQTIEEVQDALYGGQQWEAQQSIQKAIEISGKIELEINSLKQKIEAKL